MSRPGQYSSSRMHWMMGQEDASEPTYTTHGNGLALNEPSTISAVPLLSSGLLPVGLSVHDTLPTENFNDGILPPLTGLDINVSDSKTGVLPAGLLVHDTLPTGNFNDGILPALTGLDINVSDSKAGVLPVGLSVHDTLPTDNFNDGILQALTGLDINVSDSKHLLTGNQAALLKGDMAQAATEWLNDIANPGHTPINILLNITDDDKTHSKFDGSPAFLMSTGTEANDTWESAVEYKLRNGADPTTGLESFPKLSDGAQADVVININSHYLNSVGWLDPNPGEGSDPVPAYKVDMVSELVHEFGHGLGIGVTKSLSTTTGTFDAGEKTTWESLLDIEKSGTYFTGSHAIREHGGPVVVTTNTPEENYGHLGNTLSDATDPKTGGPDVMYGVSFDTGKRYEVSDLDVAILQDLGYHTKSPYETNIVEVAHPTWLDIHSLVSTLPGTIAIQANPVTNLATFLGEAGTHTADLPSHPSSGAHSDISAVTAAQVVAPTVLADEHFAPLQFDMAYVSEFAHQLHI